MVGVAHIDGQMYFMFTPDDPVPGSVVRFRRHGVAQMMTDGTFDFVAKPWNRSHAIPLLKLPHGRLSETIDGGIQLTLRVYKNELVDISRTIRDEALTAADAIRQYLPSRENKPGERE